MICPSCKSENPGTFRFCGGCGQPLTTEREEQGAAAPSHDRDAERRQITVMFCDLARSTELAGRLDPEELRDVVREYQAACAPAIEQYGGHIAQYLGDGLLVYFGYPRAHEDDARRAVLSGLAILGALDELNERLAPRIATRLAVRIGVHTGRVVTGSVGSGRRAEQLALGQVPNVAARIQAAAEDDHVLLSSATEHLVRGYFDTTSIGHPQLKGVDQPVELFRVEGETAVTSRFDVSRGRGLTRLVGRDRDVAHVLAAAREVRELGRMKALLVRGEPGIGKSRLVDQVVETLRGGEAESVHAQCSAYHGLTPFHPLTRAVERLFGILPDDPPEQRKVRLEAGLAARGLPAEFASAAGRFVLDPGSDYAPTEALPHRQKERAIGALVDVLLGEARRLGLLIVTIEDLHWVDPSTREFLERLCERAAEAPVLLLGTARLEFGLPPTWKSGWDELLLDRVDEATVREIVRELNGGREPEEGIVRTIVEMTDGVPLYVEEFTAALRDAGYLGDDRVASSDAGEKWAVPTTLQDLLAARLDSAGAAKETAQIAAVIGREFQHALLEHASGLAPDELDDRMNVLLENGLVRVESWQPFILYSFKHALLQDAAYRSMLRSARRQAHRAIATALAERMPDVASSQPELVAHHHTEAGDTQEALGLWLEAGRNAAGRSAHLEAEAHLRRGLTLLEQHEAPAELAPLELAYQTTLGGVLNSTRGFAAPDVEAAYSRAYELALEAGAVAEMFWIKWGTWAFYHVKGDLDRARDMAEQALEIATGNDDDNLRLEASYIVGAVSFYRGELSRSIECFDRALTLDRPDRPATPALLTGFEAVTGSLGVSSGVAWHLGHLADARRRADEAVARSRRSVHPLPLIVALHCRGMLAVFERTVGSASRVAREMVDHATRHGYSFWVPLAQFIVGWADAETAIRSGGDRDKLLAGLQTIDQSLQHYRMTGASILVPFMLCVQSELAVAADQRERAGALLDEALELHESTRERMWRPEMYRVRARLETGSAVGDLLRQAVQCAREQATIALEARALTGLLQWEVGRGQMESARGRMEEFTDRCRELGCDIDLDRMLAEVGPGLRSD